MGVRKPMLVPLGYRPSKKLDLPDRHLIAVRTGLTETLNTSDYIKRRANMDKLFYER